MILKKKTDVKWRDKCTEGLLVIVSILPIGKYVCPFPLPRGVEIQHCKRKDDLHPIFQSASNGCSIKTSYTLMVNYMLIIRSNLYTNVFFYISIVPVISDSAILTNISALDIHCMDSSSCLLSFDFSILLIFPYIIWIGRYIC